METYRKKLIEVALPLEAINAESAREKSIRHGHPSTLHLWWARRPLAACRAVIFSQLVDDPGSVPEEFPTDEAQEKERERLFRIIEELVKWENSTSEAVLHEARMEIARSVARNRGLKFDPKMTEDECLTFLQQHAPPILDPFCGGGSIPLEAQRLGLRAYASDLNPLAVLITKALIEIPPVFAGRPPVNPDARKQKRVQSGGWKGAHGLAEDVGYYGRWIRDEAKKLIGPLYPQAILPGELGGGEGTVIAWLWARTVPCPNPACRADSPLVANFQLSTKIGNEAYVSCKLTARSSPRFSVLRSSGMGFDDAKRGTRAGKKATFLCAACKTVIEADYIREEGKAGRLGVVLMAIVAEGRDGRVYLDPSEEQRTASLTNPPDNVLEEALPASSRYIAPPLYGLTKFRDLFTARQLVALTTFSDFVRGATERVRRDAVDAGFADNNSSIEEGGAGARAYAEAVGTYLAFGVDKMADTNSTLCTWQVNPPRLRATFGRQALPMTWDFAEAGPFADAAGDYLRCVGSICEVLRNLIPSREARVRQLDATEFLDRVKDPVIVTDPPYYDNIGYADLSDYFYVWLRRTIGFVYPNTCSTLLTPKEQELVATPYRFGGNKEKARSFFDEGLGRAVAGMREIHVKGFPLTIIYAFKQAEEALADDGEMVLSSTGWETMLEGLLRAGLCISGTWPNRSELATRNVGRGANALASSIILACRPRPKTASMATRQQFIGDLKREQPDALRNLQLGSVAPVDLQQAAIGPGMAVFSRYAKVLEAGGGVMTVRTALQIINQVRDEVLSAQETDLDHDTRWCVAWFKQHGTNEGPFGEAEVLSRAMNTAVNGLVQAGVAKAEKGKVRLLRRDELRKDYEPRDDRRPTVWEATQQLIRALDTGGEKAAAALAKKLGSVGDLAKELAYILFEVCGKRGWAQEAIPYNSLVVAWPEITRLSAAGGLERFGVGA